MNATTDTPRRPLPANRLLAHDLAVEAAAKALELAAQVPGRLRSLADQLVRSAPSVPANLAEGRADPGETVSTTSASRTAPHSRRRATSSAWLPLERWISGALPRCWRCSSAYAP